MIIFRDDYHNNVTLPLVSLYYIQFTISMTIVAYSLFQEIHSVDFEGNNLIEIAKGNINRPRAIVVDPIQQ